MSDRVPYLLVDSQRQSEVVVASCVTGMPANRPVPASLCVYPLNWKFATQGVEAAVYPVGWSLHRVDYVPQCVTRALVGGCPW